MKLLVVFDHTSKAPQNLLAALKAAQLIQTDKPELRNSLEVRVCVLALLPEDKPLDSYLGEMEQTNQKALRTARQIVAEEKVGNVTIELLMGMEPEVAELIARRAKEWQADQIYLSSPQECFSCKKARLDATLRTNWKRFPLFNFGTDRRIDPANSTPVSVSDEPKSAVEIGELLDLTGSRIVLTCHGEVNLAVQKYHPRSGSRCERVVYERV